MDGRARQSPRPAGAGCGRPLSAKTDNAHSPDGSDIAAPVTLRVPCRPHSAQPLFGTTKQSTEVRRLAPQQTSAARALPPALRITVARNDNTKFGGAASCAATGVSRACPAARTPHNRCSGRQSKARGAASCAATGVSRACPAARTPHNRMCGTTTQSSGARGYNTPATRNIR